MSTLYKDDYCVENLSSNLFTNQVNAWCILHGQDRGIEIYQLNLCPIHYSLTCTCTLSKSVLASCSDFSDFKALVSASSARLLEALVRSSAVAHMSWARKRTSAGTCPRRSLCFSLLKAASAQTWALAG